MKINIIAVGKIKEDYLRDAIDEYAKRISRYAEFNVIEIAEAPCGKSPQEQRRLESERLLEKARGCVVVLDGAGKQMSSVRLAEYLDSRCTGGVCEFSFLIGGSHGHSETLKAKADIILSFGLLTFPHQLSRVMLSEQLYRALCIMNNTPYHK